MSHDPEELVGTWDPDPMMSIQVSAWRLQVERAERAEARLAEAEQLFRIGLTGHDVTEAEWWDLVRAFLSESRSQP